MANIVSSKTYLNDLEINADAPVTTQLNTRIGGAINYLNDKTDSLQGQTNGILNDTSLIRVSNLQYPFVETTPDYIWSVPTAWQMVHFFIFREPTIPQPFPQWGSPVFWDSYYILNFWKSYNNTGFTSAIGSVTCELLVETPTSFRLKFDGPNGSFTSVAHVKVFHN